MNKRDICQRIRLIAQTGGWDLLAHVLVVCAEVEGDATTFRRIQRAFLHAQSKAVVPSFACVGDIESYLRKRIENRRLTSSFYFTTVQHLVSQLLVSQGEYLSDAALEKETALALDALFDTELNDVRPDAAVRP